MTSLDDQPGSPQLGADVALLAEHLRFGDLEASQKTLELGSLGGGYPGCDVWFKDVGKKTNSHHPVFWQVFFFAYFDLR